MKSFLDKKYIYLNLFLIFLFFFSYFVNLEADIKGQGERIVSLGEIDSLEVNIKFGAGKFKLGCGEKSVFKGNFLYKNGILRPNIHYEILGKNGILNLSQSIKKDINLRFPLQNDWDLRLPSDIPLQIYVNAATYSGDINLSNLKVKKFSLVTGISSTNIMFNQLNKIDLRNINIKCGASAMTISGLANANFDKMDFNGGAGVYAFDFSGELIKKSKVKINAGAAKIILKIPSEIRTRIKLRRFPLVKLDIKGFVKINDQVYANTEYGKKEAELDIEINGGFLSVEVDTFG
ncbi:MAG: toast rack family protein [Candidatus Caldatribacteriota bacterium]|nr:toast rack family protein [Candidatus Caldatribacteriota bacterium]